jgi:uncharacterized membrane protein YkoI
MHATPRFALLTTLALTTATVARAQSGAQPAAQPAAPQTMQVKESKPGLLRRATITPDAATRTAMQQVPNGEIREAEIEQEKGKLVYSYDIKAPGKTGIDEVLVDARTGAVVSHTHESPAAEAAEARSDARAARKAGAMKRPTGAERGERGGERGEKPDTR